MAEPAQEGASKPVQTPTIVLEDNVVEDGDEGTGGRACSCRSICAIFVLVIALSIGLLSFYARYMLGTIDPRVQVHDIYALARYRFAAESGSPDQGIQAHMLSPLGLKLITSGALPSANYFIDTLLPGLYPWVALRALQYDKIVAQALIEGVKQIVVLGAGFDTTAYRFVSDIVKHNANVYEVDDRITQSEKRSRVARARLNKSAVQYVPIDLTRDALEDTLLDHLLFDEDLPTLFLWQGDTMFTSARVIDRVLKLVGISAPGSSIAFDFVDKRVLSGTCPGRGGAELKRAATALDRRLRFGLTPSNIKRYLGKRALAVRKQWSAPQLAKEIGGKVSAAAKLSPMDCVGLVHAEVMWPKKLGGES